MLSKYIQERRNRWDEFLDTSVYAYNTSSHESTRFTPFELMFGRKAVLPIDIDVLGKEAEEKVRSCLEELSTSAAMRLTERRRHLLEQAKINILKAQEKQKRDYDLRRANPKAYEIGSKVLKKDFLRRKRAGGKMDAKYLGPYVITGHLGKGLYSLHLFADPSRIIQRVNGAYLKPYHTPPLSRSESSENECFLSPQQRSLNTTEAINSSISSAEFPSFHLDSPTKSAKCLPQSTPEKVLVKRSMYVHM